MRSMMKWIFAMVCLAGCMAAASAADATLAMELSKEKAWSLSALEFRRLAMGEAVAAEAAGWYWMSAYAYAAAEDWQVSEKMLMRAEDAEPDVLGAPIAWLRAENALAERDWASAAFHFGSLQGQAADAEWKRYAARGEAAADLRDGRGEAAQVALAPFVEELPEAQEALARYMAGRDKKPWLGGLLGMVPGLGYAYAGEYANAFRSLLLNSLFIWAMVETAAEDQWALFTVSTFFELTWYTGSIYGGMDSVHRHNARRLEEAARAVRGPDSVSPDEKCLPIISLRFDF